MFVKWRMTTNPFTIGPDATVPEAIEVMQTKKVRKLPVMAGGKLVGEVLVVADLLRVDGTLEVEDRPRAHGEGEPQAVRVAQLAGDALHERLRGHRLEEPQLLGAPQAAGVHRDQHVGRAAGAFVLQALEKRVLVGLDAVHLDAGLPGEVGVQRIVGLVVARGVEVEDLLLGKGGKRGGDGQGECEGGETVHGSSGRGMTNLSRNDSHLSNQAPVSRNAALAPCAISNTYRIPSYNDSHELRP